jgi:quinoprotein glucose dehydrogenase
MKQMKRLTMAGAGVVAGLLARGIYADPAPAPDAPAKTKESLVMPASDEGELAISKFKVAPGLKVSLFAAEPDLANVVAINCDEKGRWYVAETFRRRQGVMDIRGIMSWLDEDLACQTVEDRLAESKRHMGSKYSDLSVYSDRVSMIEDRDGDGKADHSSIFADGFGSPADGIAAGIVARKGNVYLTCIPNLWLLKDTDGDGKADVRKSLQYGYGVRVGFLGHDLHGPRFGPDGKLYLSIGDRAFNVNTERGPVKNLESGSVLRCNPDGTELEIFATGLRNPQQLCFDDYGNLFSGDNNCDHGDPARWVYIVEGADNGWRVGYQHMPNAGPWNSEKIHALPEKNDCASIVPPVAHLGAGPSGVAHYPGTGLPEKYKDHFWMVDFRGTATGSGIHCFALSPKGAGFEMTDRSQFIWNVLATDCVFGVNGGLYLSDWVGGWAVTGKGRIYRVHDEAVDKSPLVKETQRIMAEGMEKRASAELAKLLAHPDQRVRQEAQFELADRAEIGTLAGVIKSTDQTLPRIHAIWGLGQIARKTPAALNSVVSLLSDKDPEVKAQAAKVLGDGHVGAAEEGLIADLSDPSPRVEFFAAIALGKIANPQAQGALVDLIKRNNNDDGWLRHAGVMGLVGTAKADELAKLSSDSSPAVRMGALLALRRMGSTQVSVFLKDSDPWVVLEAARAINDAPVNAAMPELAKLADAKGLDGRVMKRVINANLRIGGLEQAEALARIAKREDVATAMRVEALDALGTWENPSGRDRVLGLWRPVPAGRDATAAAKAVGPLLEALTKAKAGAVRVAALKLSEKIGNGGGGSMLETITSKTAPAEEKAASLNAMAARKDPKLEQALRAAMLDGQPVVRKAAIILMAKDPAALKTLQGLLSTGSVADQQAVYDAVAGIDVALVDQILSDALDKLAAGTLPKEVALDVTDAARKAKTNAIKEKLAAYEAGRSKTDELAPYREALFGGDAANGRKIFFERQDAQCVRCHLAGNKNESGQPMVGPELTGIGSKKDREYFLESIVFPNKQVAPGYEGVQVRLKTRKGVAGVLKAEDETSLSIDVPEKGIVKVLKADIVSREKGPSAMPEGLGQILSKRDIRDLVEFLTTLK